MGFLGKIAGKTLGGILEALAPALGGGMAGKMQQETYEPISPVQGVPSINEPGGQSSQMADESRDDMMNNFIQMLLEKLAPGSKGEFSPLSVLGKLAPSLKKHDKSKEHGQIEKLFSGGGMVNPHHNGYINLSHSAGDADDIKMDIPDKSYVMNATDLSLLGNGNPDNGAVKVASWEENMLKSGVSKPTYEATSTKMIPAKVSNKEYVLKPETVTILGKGDNRKGAEEMNKMRKNLRKQKGVKDILPPKSKNVSHYMRGGR